MMHLHGGGRMEEKRNIAMHCTEMNGEECMRHDVKEKEKHRDSMVVNLVR